MVPLLQIEFSSFWGGVRVYIQRNCVDLFHRYWINASKSYFLSDLSLSLFHRFGCAITAPVTYPIVSKRLPDELRSAKSNKNGSYCMIPLITSSNRSFSTSKIENQINSTHTQADVYLMYTLSLCLYVCETDYSLKWFVPNHLIDGSNPA